ncbi:HlyD family efflux transporter periplasmic adaptor subunit [Anaerolineales bacterium HSG25]|nr:HlyD family efflux transporter periplasmic adaptor subunit [Anaerolineales bacterium HSG25]
MRKNYFLIVSMIVLLGIVLTGCNTASVEEDTATEDIPVVTAVNDQVSAESFIEPVRYLDVTFETSGQIVELLIEEGQLVTAGEVIARLDDSDLKAAIQVAEANLNKAQADVTAIKAGPTDEEIAQAQAGILKTEAELVKLITGATPEEIAVAESKVRTRQAQLSQVLASARPGQLEAAASAVILAEVEVGQAQSAYDEGQFALDSDVRAARLHQAQASLAKALAEFNRLNNGATDETVAIARASVNLEQTALEKVTANQIPQRIAEAQINVQDAEVALARLLAGNTDEAIAIREAGVKQAEVALQKAVNDLDKAELIAPFGGIIANLPIEESEFINNGATVMTLADTSEWLIKTDDLTEIDIVSVQEGQVVEVEVDALPSETFTGIVTRIKPMAETKAGDVTYTVEVKLTSDGATDSQLRWGMTVNVNIETETL